MVTRAAERRTWTVLVEQTDGDPERERLLLAGGRAPGGQLVDGLLISPWALPRRTAAWPRRSAVVLLGEQDAAGLFDRVAIDNVAAAADATRHLIATGRRRIAAIGLQPHLANGTAEQRHLGYRAALAEAGLEPDPALEVAVAALHRGDGAAAMRGLSRRAALRRGLLLQRRAGPGCTAGRGGAGRGRPARRCPGGLRRHRGRAVQRAVADHDRAGQAAIAEAALDRLGARLAPGDAPGPARSVVVGHRLITRESTA